MAKTITLSQAGLPSVTIRNPEFGNTESIEIGRINRKTRGGDIRVFRNPIWPITNKFSYHFTALKRAEAIALLTFIQQTNGTIVQLLDYEGRSWNGFVINPNCLITEAGPNNMFTAQFDFEWVSYNA